MYLFMFCAPLIHFIGAHRVPRDSTNYCPFLPLVMLLLTGILMIPSLVNSLFTGRSGESAIRRF